MAALTCFKCLGEEGRQGLRSDVRLVTPNVPQNLSQAMINSMIFCVFFFLLFHFCCLLSDCRNHRALKDMCVLWNHLASLWDKEGGSSGRGLVVIKVKRHNGNPCAVTNLSQW